MSESRKIERADGSVHYLDEAGELHRIDGPALLEKNKKEWWVDGQRHRDNGPAVISQEDNWESKEWFKRGLRHRENAPALIQKNKSEKVLIEEYWEKDKLHRTQGPAVYRLVDNLIAEKSYYYHGSPHREGGPALISPTLVMWAYKGVIHNENCPARIQLFEDNWEYFYYLNDRMLKEDNKFDQEKLKEIKNKESDNFVRSLFADKELFDEEDILVAIR